MQQPIPSDRLRLAQTPLPTGPGAEIGYGSASARPPKTATLLHLHGIAAARAPEPARARATPRLRASLPPPRLTDEEMRDRELLGRIAKSDRQAFRELYDRHLVHVTQAVRRLAPAASDHDLEEIVTNAFMALWPNERASAAVFSGRSSVRTWLVSIARFKAHDQLRVACEQQTSMEPIESFTELADGPSDMDRHVDDGPEEACAKSKLSEVVAALLDLLPWDKRAVVELHYLQGYDMGEIGALVGCPRDTAKTRYHYAIRALKKHLANLGIHRVDDLF